MNLEFLPEDVQFCQIRGIFLESAASIIRQLEESVWRCGGQGLELHLTEINRLSHTLKGSSLQLGFVEIGRVAQWIEERSGECLGAGRYTNDDRERFHEGVSALDEMLRCLNQDRPLPDPRSLCPGLQVETP